MSVLRAWVHRLGGLFRRPERDRELERELETHLEFHIEDNLRRGMSPEEARRAALIRLGGIEQAKEQYRDQRGLPFVERFIQDVRYALRTLGADRGFTVVAVLTLALGIGANTAIFSIVEDVLLRPLPFRDPSRLVLLNEHRPGKVDDAGVPYPDYVAWRDRNVVFSETAAYWQTGAVDDIVLGGPNSAERVEYSVVTNSFFSILGVEPAIGRAFAAEDEKPGGAKLFLASDLLWQRVFGGKVGAVGKTFLLDGEAYTLSGVMPRGFDFPRGCDVWIPVGALGTRAVDDRDSHPFRILGRLKRGASVEQARAQIDTIQSQLAKAYPKTDAEWRVRAQPLVELFVGRVRTSLLVLLGAVAFILLIACVNVANLTLARATTREKEFAIRSVLGASRARLAQQAVTESLLIAVISASAGFALAVASLRGIGALSAGRIPRLEAFHLNAPVLWFVAGVALLTTILVGAAPALEVSEPSFRGSLREGTRGETTGIRSQRLRNALVISEVALTIVLLSGAGLMLRSFFELSRVSPGFRPESLITVKIALPGAQYTHGAQTSAFLDRLLVKLRALPGVWSAAAANFVPFSGESDWGAFQIVGREALDWSEAPSAEGRSVSPDYFRTMGIRLVRGREFTDEDQRQHADVAIINEAMARKFWPGADPIGQRILNMDRPRGQAIIGIVGDVKSFGLDADSPPEMYSPYGSWWYMNLVLRSTLSPASLLAAVRDQVSGLDKGVAVYSLSTMEGLMSRSVAPRRFNLFLLGLFAALALVLAMVGIYGVLAFGVTRRRHEIGIRMALGAHPGQVLELIVWQGMRLVLVGAGIGVAASLGLTRFLSTLLFGIHPDDPLTLACVPLLLAVAALAACYAPARRATRIDPMLALRHE
ncbi:MAG TPA: ABC transporter permease [Candidatus Cybelea sp.]|nr:ABC transporter permease [Candidatus Cybelea sp.]